jgi:hypothetical protein
MKKDITNIASSLPSLNKLYAPLDIVGNTIGRYFDYKRDTAMVKYETQKIKEQTKIILRQIDAELKKSLDFNDKAFKKEMFRLQTIATALQANSQNKKKILIHISELTRLLGDSSVPLSVKENIPKLIAIAYESLANESSESMSKLRLMSEFDSNQKLIKGD